MKCVMVIGLPCSGTSVLAAVVHYLGVQMLMPHDPKWNEQNKDPRYPLGNFECSWFRELIWRLADPEDGEPASQRLRSRYRLDFTEHEQLLVRNWLDARSLSARESLYPFMFGVKKPTLPMVFIPLHQMLEEAGHSVIVLNVWRHMASCIESQMEKHGTTMSPGEAREWAAAVQHYHLWRMKQTLNYVRDKKIPMYQIPFRSLIDYPKTFVPQIAQFLGVDYTDEALSAIHNLVAHYV